MNLVKQTSKFKKKKNKITTGRNTGEARTSSIGKEKNVVLNEMGRVRLEDSKMKRKYNSGVGSEEKKKIGKNIARGILTGRISMKRTGAD